MDEKKIDNTLLKKKVAMKTMKSSVLGQESRVMLLHKKKCMLINKIESLRSYSSQKTTIGLHSADKFLQSVLLIYLGLAHSVEKAVLKWTGREIFGLVRFI